MNKIFYTLLTVVTVMLFSLGLNAQSCDYTLALTDSFGDSWSGNTLTVDIDGVSTNYTNSTNAPVNSITDEFTLDIPDGAAVTLTFNATGTYVYECSYTLTDAFGAVVVNVTQGSAAGSVDMIVGDCPLPCGIEIVGNPQTEYLLQSGECDAIVNFDVECTGDCVLLDEENAVSGFVGDFAPDAPVFTQNDPCGLSVSEDEATLETLDPLAFGFGGANDCTSFATVVEWTATSPGVIAFDWSTVNTEPLNSDYFGYAVNWNGGYGHFFGGGPNPMDLGIPALSSSTTSGSVAGVVVGTGDEFLLINWMGGSYFADGGTPGNLTATVTNFTFTPFSEMEPGIVSVNVLAPVGPSTVEYCVVEASGNELCVTLDVNVTAYTPNSNAMACNDNVQVSLDENCEALISADQFLEGNDYSCYLDDYNVYIEGFVGNVNNTSLALAPGEYVVTVENANGNSCWSTMTVEDKLAPVIECDCPVGGTIPLGAVVTEYVGALASGDTQANFGVACQNFGGGAPLGGLHFYDTYQFQVSVDGNYTFAGTSAWGDAHMVIYDAPLGADVCANVVDGDGDGGPGFDPLITANPSLAFNPGIGIPTFARASFPSNNSPSTNAFPSPIISNAICDIGAKSPLAPTEPFLHT